MKYRACINVQMEIWLNLEASSPKEAEDMAFKHAENLEGNIYNIDIDVHEENP